MTLAETLVVLSVIAVASGAAVSGLLPRPVESVGTEAARLSQVLTLAADTALANRQALALVWDEGSYGFRAASATGWDQPADGPLAQDRRLPPDMDLWREEGGTTLLPLRPDGLSPRTVLVLGDGRDQRRVVFDGLSARVAGEADP